jgi:MFS family permease
MLTSTPASAPNLGRGYWSLLVGSSISSLADGSFKVALPLIARATTDSPGLIAGVTFAATLPWLLFSLPVGALVDRGDRRRIMLVANAGRTVLLALFGILCGCHLESIPMLYVVAFVAGIAEVFYDTSARAIVPMIVPRPLLPRANTFQQVSDQTANQFAGPALGGLLVGIGVAVSSFTSSGIWLLAVGSLVMLRGSFRTGRRSETTLRVDVVIGIRYLLGSRVLRSITATGGVTNFAVSGTVAVFVVYAVGPGSALHLSSAEYGLLLTVSAAGSITGAFLVGRIRHLFGERGLMTSNIVTQAIQLAIPIVTHNLFVVAGGFLVGGVGIALWNVGTVTIRQRLTPHDLLGRVLSAHRLVSWGCLSLGALAGGLLGEIMPIRTVFLIMVTITLTALLATRSWSATAIAEEEHREVEQ